MRHRCIELRGIELRGSELRGIEPRGSDLRALVSWNNGITACAERYRREMR